MIDGEVDRQMIDRQIDMNLSEKETYVLIISNVRKWIGSIYEQSLVYKR